MSNILIKFIDNRSYKSFFLPLLVLILFYLIHFLYFVPFWPFNPDTLDKLNFIKENLDFNANYHHHLRWGSYFIYKISSYFIIHNFITLTSISFIIFLLSVLLFTYSVHINLGLAYSCLFVLFWITNKSINLEIFSFSTVNQTLLALSILFLYLQRLLTSSVNSFHAFFISLILFWLYGIKETNIFFFPLLFFFNVFRENLTLVLKIIFFCLLFFLLETIVINYFSDQNYIFGRLSALLSDNAQHKNVMYSDVMQAYYNEGVDSNIKKFFLIFYRWYSARDWDTTIFYISFFLSIFFLFNKDHKDIVRNNFLELNSLLIISFFLCNTFFIISLLPPTIGQPLNTRVLTILLPFSFISIIIFIKIIISSSSNKIISSLLIIIVLFTFFSRPVYSLLAIDENWGDLSLLSHKGNNAWDRYTQFDKFYKKINNYNCIVIKSKNPHVRNILIRMTLFIDKKINLENWSYIYNDNLIKKIKSEECKNRVIIKENGIIFD